MKINICCDGITTEYNFKIVSFETYDDCSYRDVVFNYPRYATDAIINNDCELLSQYVGKNIVINVNYKTISIPNVGSVTQASTRKRKFIRLNKGDFSNEN